MGRIKNIFLQRSRDYTFQYLQPSQVPNQTVSIELPAEEYYINIHLKSLRIVNVRRGISKFYGAVHSFVTLPHRRGENAQFNVLTTPNKLQELDAQRIDRVISVNKRLLGPIPYIGGDLQLEIGLFSIKSANLAAPFISLLDQISEKAGVALVQQAMPFAEPLQSGIDLLTGAGDDTILEIGLATDFGKVKTGYIVVMRAEKGTVDIDQLKVDDTDFKLIDQKGNPVSDFPYMVLEISASKRRDAWQSIPYLKNAYSALKSELRNRDSKAVDRALAYFETEVFLAEDLLERDIDRIINKVQTDVKRVMRNTRSISMSAQKEIKNLDDFDIYDNI